MKEKDIEGRLAALIDDAAAFGDGPEHRREALLERAESRGLDRGVAERAYDVAREVGLEPAYALLVVAEGVSVQSYPRSSGAEATEAVEPEWIDRPPSPEDARRERRLRETFRRLRSLLEDSPTPRDAFTRFAEEPDLEAYDY